MSCSRGRFPFVFLALLILLSFLNVISTKADDDYEYVLDSNGKKITNGATYKLSVESASGDTEISVHVIKRWPGSKLCWLSVVLSHDKGIPVTITHSIIEPKHVVTDFPVRVSFSDLPFTGCTDTSQWALVDGLTDDDRKQDLAPVMVGNDDPEELGIILTGYFYVKPYNHRKHQYKFLFCQRFGDSEDCNDIGVYVDPQNSNIKRLTSTFKKHLDPLVFTFQKVTTHHDI